MVNKNFLRVLYGIIILMGSMHAKGTTTNKSFFSLGGLRDKNVRFSLNRYLLEYNQDRTGGCLEVSPFYSASSRSAFLAGALTPNGKQNATIDNPGVGIDLDLTYNQGILGTTSLAGKYSLAPTYKVGGMHFMWIQRLDGISEGWYIMLASTLASVSAHPNLTATGADATRIKNYFQGSDATDPANVLTRTYGKINNERLKASGLADVDLELGYRFVENENYYAGVYGIVSMPTSGPVKADYLFTPILGDNNHYALGFGFNFEKILVHENEHSLSFFTDIELRYRLTNTQQRIPGLKGIPNAHLMIVNGGTAAASNYLTTDVKVDAGATANLMSGLSYTFENLTCQLGYELNAFSAETLYLEPGKPFIVQSLAPITVTTGALTVPITAENLDFTPASSPTRLVNKVFGSLGYILNKEEDYPLVLGCGGSYTFAGNNNTIVEGWGVFVKASLGF